MRTGMFTGALAFLSGFCLVEAFAQTASPTSSAGDVERADNGDYRSHCRSQGRCRLTLSSRMREGTWE